MTADERQAMKELEERVAHLEGLVANAMRASAPPAGRWLASARYENACAGACNGRVKEGERCWYVPKSATDKAKVFHEACAPAEANAKTNGKVAA